MSIMKSTLNHLKLVYIWPKWHDEKLASRGIYLAKFIAFICSGSFLFLGGILHLVMSIRDNEPTNMVQDIVTINGQFGVIYFTLFCVIYQRTTSKIVSELSNFDEFGKPPNFDKRNAQLNKLSKIFRFVLLLTIIGVFSWPALYTNECEKFNELRLHKDVCGLVSPVWLPFDFSDFPRKHLVYAWQCYCCLVTFGGASVSSFFMLETMEHLIVRIQHLKSLILDVVKERNFQIRQQMFGKWMRYHLYILRIGDRMSTSYQNSLFVHVVCAGVLFGCIGYSIIAKTSTVNAISLFIGWFTSLCIVCIGGQRLMDEASSVGTAIYDTEWYNLDYQFQKNLIPVISRARKSILISAGPFTNLSHLLILTILQTAYSYVNLLTATS